MDESTFWVILLVILAIVVGAAIPALIQLTLTLRTARRVLDSSGQKLDKTLAEITTATQRINRVGAGLEDTVQKARDLVDNVAGLGESVTRLRDSIRTAAVIGNAVGPAVAAAVRAFWQNGSRGKPPDASVEPSESGPGEAPRETNEQEEAR